MTGVRPLGMKGTVPMTESITILGGTAYLYGIFIAAAALIYLLLMGVTGYRRGLPVGSVRVFGVLAVPLGILFSRLVFCLLNLSLFIDMYENPWLMLRFFDGGMSMAGLLLGLMLAAWIAALLMKVRIGKLFDVMALPLGLFIAICRAGEYFTELGVGKVVEEGLLTRHMPWLFLTETMGAGTEYRFAVYGYEAVAGILIFLWMLCLNHSLRKNKDVRSGDLSLVFFALYGAAQVILESMRDDGHMLIIFLRVSQVFAVFLTLIAAGVFTARYIAIRRRVDLRVFISWVLLLLCVAAGVLLEFSLDGRLTWGTPTLLRDYGLMAVACVILLCVPYSLFTTLCKKVYRERHIIVRI